MIEDAFPLLKAAHFFKSMKKSWALRGIQGIINSLRVEDKVNDFRSGDDKVIGISIHTLGNSSKQAPIKFFSQSISVDCS